MENNKITFTVSNSGETLSSGFSSKNEQFNFSNNRKPNDIYSLAKAFLSISKMTNKKLQKLC